MQKTFSPKAKEITREWHVIDADGVRAIGVVLQAHHRCDAVLVAQPQGRLARALARDRALFGELRALPVEGASGCGRPSATTSASSRRTR